MFDEVIYRTSKSATFGTWERADCVYYYVLSKFQSVVVKFQTKEGAGNSSWKNDC